MLMIHAYFFKVTMLMISISNQINILQACDWFVGNKLSMHVREDRTKTISFALKHERKIPKLDIIY